MESMFPVCGYAGMADAVLIVGTEIAGRDPGQVQVLAVQSSLHSPQSIERNIEGI